MLLFCPVLFRFPLPGGLHMARSRVATLTVLLTGALLAPPLMAVPAVPASIDAPAALAAFGRSIAIAGDFAFIGEPGGRGAGGKVWVYQRQGTSWRMVTSIEAPEGAEQGFGIAVASDGTFLMVGQHRPALVDVPADLLRHRRRPARCISTAGAATGSGARPVG
jgi:hypothetical protein